MEIDGNIIYILFAIAYVIFQVFSGSKKKKAPKGKTISPKETTPNKEQKEITTFEDLFETIKKANAPREKSATTPPPIVSKQAQEIEKTKEALKNESHRIRPRIKAAQDSLELVDLEDEIEVDNSGSSANDFDIESIDWPKAIITKEILERKYT